MTLDEARASIGETVLYDPGPAAEQEEGVITRVSAVFVYVRYGADADVGSKATHPGDLRLLVGGA